MARSASPARASAPWYRLPPRQLVERLLILLAWVNLGLAAFDMTYIPLRSFYLRGTLFARQQLEDNDRLFGWVGEPGDVRLFYDPIKGIQPEPETQAYLATVDRLAERLDRGLSLQSDETLELLAELRQQSDDILTQNPFQFADQTSTLELIRDRMRQHMEVDSASEAFETFWTADHLQAEGWSGELDFFYSQLRFPFQSNYVRRTAANGLPVDRFAAIDTPFIIIFAVDFVIRTLWIRRRYPQLSLRSNVFSHWTDIFFLLPFWRWLRIIPTVERSNKANFPNLEPVRALISRGILASVAGELTEVVVLQAVSTLQYAVRSGVLSQQLTSNASTYVEINDVNEVQAIAGVLAQAAVYRVLPEVRADLEALLDRQLALVLNDLPAYRQVKTLPGFAELPQQIAHRLAVNLSGFATEAPQTAYRQLSKPLEPKTAELLERLGDRASKAFGEALTDDKVRQELEDLVWELLEELKLSYVSRARDEQDSLEILQEAEKLRRQAGKARKRS